MKKKIVEKVKKVLKAEGLVIAGAAGATVYFLIRNYMREPDGSDATVRYFDRSNDPNILERYTSYIEFTNRCRNPKRIDGYRIFLPRECACGLFESLRNTLSGVEEE